MGKSEIEYKEGKVIIEKIGDKTRILLKPNTNFSGIKECVTDYPLELIKKIIEAKGYFSLCDDIQRDQHYEYIQKPLEYLIFSHFDKSDFDNKRILDFGCGAGNSSVIIGRFFKNTEIIGVELNGALIELANKRKEHHKLSNIHFFQSKNGTELPDNLGTFDFIFLNAVYEHLLPDERKILFPTLYDLLNTNGSILINETPHRWFPVETHTTEGLPLINYFPDKIAHFFVKKFSNRYDNKYLTWKELQRAGIRGGSVNEVRKILRRTGKSVKILTPKMNGIKDRVDLFDKSLDNNRLSPTKKKILFEGLKIIKILTGIILTPTLAFVMKKE